MTERETKMEKAFESFLKEVEADKHINAVEEVKCIFSRIKVSPSATEKFVKLLKETSYLKCPDGTLRKFDKDDIDKIVGKLTHLETVLQGFKTFKQEVENTQKSKKLEKLRQSP